MCQVSYFPMKIMLLQLRSMKDRYGDRYAGCCVFTLYRAYKFKISSKYSSKGQRSLNNIFERKHLRSLQALEQDINQDLLSQRSQSSYQKMLFYFKRGLEPNGQSVNCG